MGSITRADVKNFEIYLGSKNLSTESINQITRIGVTALKWAFFNKFTQNNCFDGIFYCSINHKVREILTFDEAQKLFKSEWKHKSSKLANLIAMCTGLRASEIRALRLCDIGEDRIYVRHSWSDFEHKLKSPKNSCERQVPLPKFLMKILVDYLNCEVFAEVSGGFFDDSSDDSGGFSCGFCGGQKISLAKGETAGESSCSLWRKKLNQQSFLFASKVLDSKNQQIPENPKKWRLDLKNQLKSLGIQKENVVFHSWRHFYSTVMAEQVELRKLSLVTGHKSLKVLEHYSEHVLDEDWRQVQEISEKLFSSKMESCFGQR